MPSPLRSPDSLVYVSEVCSKTVESDTTAVTTYFHGEKKSKYTSASVIAGFEKLPEEVIFLDDSSTIGLLTYGINSKGRIFKAESFYTYYRDVSNPPGCWIPLTCCAYCQGSERTYIEGVGGPYYDCQDTWQPFNRVLKYYKKGSEVYGSHYSCNLLLGAEAIQETPLFKVSPNPFSDEARILCDGSFRFPCHLILYDVSGKIVLEQKLSNPSEVLMRGALNSGLHFYLVTDSEGRRETGKIVVGK